MPNAKITSKGQVTIPVEVRNALGLATGDMIAFETQADYVVVKRVPTALEVAEKLDAVEPLGTLGGRTEDEVIAAYFEEDWDAGWGPTLYVVGGKAQAE